MDGRQHSLGWGGVKLDKKHPGTNTGRLLVGIAWFITFVHLANVLIQHGSHISGAEWSLARKLRVHKKSDPKVLSVMMQLQQKMC